LIEGGASPISIRNLDKIFDPESAAMISDPARWLGTRPLFG
jgi:hypothetical protein